MPKMIFEPFLPGMRVESKDLGVNLPEVLTLFSHPWSVPRRCMPKYMGKFAERLFEDFLKECFILLRRKESLCWQFCMQNNILFTGRCWSNRIEFSLAEGVR